MTADPAGRFADLVASGHPALDEALACIAAAGRRTAGVEAMLGELDAIAADVARPTVAGVVEHVCIRLGFTGDRDSYGDPDNSYLDRIIERRRGLPITLAIVVAAVGERVGAPMAVVGLPAHVVLRDATEPDRYVDAFDGVVLTEGACIAAWQARTGHHGFDRRWLRPSPPVTTIERVLNNLRRAHGERGDAVSLAQVVRLRCMMPGATDDDRAELLRLDARFN